METNCLSGCTDAAYDDDYDEFNVNCHTECFKDDNASQWKSGKFDFRSLENT